MFHLSDAQLWQVLENSLGPTKVAYLRYAPLSEIVGAKIQSKIGCDLQGGYELRDGMAYVLANAHTRVEENTLINRSIKAAEALGVTAQRHSGDSLVQKLADIVKIANMEQAFPDQAEKLAGVRYSIEDEVVDSLFSAFVSEEKLASFSRGLGEAAAKGLAAGVGLAVPGYLAADHLADNKINKARDTALMTAAGATALAAGGYVAANRLTANKQAAHQVLATALFIDQLIEPKTAAARVNRATVVSALADLMF